MLWRDLFLDIEQDGRVRAWRDRSSARNNAMASSAAKSPKYIQRGLNDRPAIEFSGDGWLRVSRLAPGPGPVTLFVVMERPQQLASDAKWQRVLSCWDGKSDGDNKPGSFQLSLPESTPMKPTILAELLPAGHRGELWIGANMRGRGNRLQGRIGEILIYDRAFLVDEQVQQVKEYLYRKWAIDKDPDEAWTRLGKLSDQPVRTNDHWPLSDQDNQDGWVRFEPLWDEFSGDSLDQNKWWDHNPTWYGRPPSRFLGEGQNVHVRDGMLHLIMKRDDTLPPFNPYKSDDKFHSYSSASVVSKQLVRYGYFEISSRAMDSGGSSAFWFSSRVRERESGKTYRSEIDVFEIGGKAIGHESAYHMNAHIFETPADGRRHWNRGGTWIAPFHFADDFHVFGLHWTAESLVYFVNGVPVRRMKNTHWHAPQRLIFDSETMGSWLGMPNDKDLPSTFRIQYVRAWKNAETDSDWTDRFEPIGDPAAPTSVTRYVRSMDRHSK